MFGSNQQSNKGQVIVIMALALVALLGFAALAIDGGMAYSDRRVAQAAADASALAGAKKAADVFDNPSAPITYTSWSTCGQAVNAMIKAKDAAVKRAESNQFVIDTNISDHNGADATCTFANKGSYKDKYLEIRVQISFTTQTAFIHLFMPGGLNQTVTAVTRIRPRTQMEYGYAVVGLGETCGNNSGGVFFDGTSDTKVVGGGIVSNSCLDKNGSSGTVKVCDDNSPTCTTNNVGVYSMEPPSGHTETISPAPKQLPAGSSPIPDFNVAPPDCASLPTPTSWDDTLDPGNYPSIKVNNGESLTLNPGLYCFSGDFVANGGSITGSGVTIYMKSGSAKMTGGTIKLGAPTDEDCAPAYKGMLFFLAHGNTGSIELVGNGDSSFVGTVYAPNGTIDIGGNGEVLPTYNTQLVGNIVKTHGTSTINVQFNETFDFIRLPMLEMNQ